MFPFLESVPMPEVPVNENRHLGGPENDVRAPRQVFRVLSETETSPVKRRAHKTFYAGVFASNPGHAEPALLRCQVVHTRQSDGSSSPSVTGMS